VEVKLVSNQPGDEEGSIAQLQASGLTAFLLAVQKKLNEMRKVSVIRSHNNNYTVGQKQAQFY
jgi:hypothetical protein